MAAQAELDEFFSAVPEADAPWTLPEDVSVMFELLGEGGGSWTVCTQQGRLSAQRNTSAIPDCRLRCSVADFRALLRGEIDARQGFFDGRLEVEGDVGIILRLARANHKRRTARKPSSRSPNTSTHR